MCESTSQQENWRTVAKVASEKPSGQASLGHLTVHAAYIFSSSMLGYKQFVKSAFSVNFCIQDM